MAIFFQNNRVPWHLGEPLPEELRGKPYFELVADGDEATWLLWALERHADLAFAVQQLKASR